MIQEVRIPSLGENIETADVTSVLVAVGESVQAEQALLEVESDKASLEVPAPFAGVVRELRIQAGQKIKVGQVIATIDTASAAQSASAPASAAPPAAAPASPAASSPASAPAATVTTASPAAPVAPVAPSKRGRPGEIGNPAPASPSVRRLARELGAEIQRIQGSGPGGRIRESDVKQYVKDVVQRRGVAAGGGGAMSAPPLPDFSAFGAVRREAMSGIRRKTAEKMALSWNTIPHVTQYDDADITEIEEFRKAKSKKLEKSGQRITVTAITLKALAQALRMFPKFNACLDLQNDEIVYKDYVHIGVAVDTERGLLVPVIRNVDQKGVLEISRELNELAERARDRKIKPEELMGGNISLTNLGGLGTTYFTPIVNWPDVAVLGVGRAKMQPVWNGKEFRPRMMMPFSVSYDHRIIDGADAARFLRWICEALEQPIHMAL
ncbi:MAG: 2-oxo acid dehydrogenase subunit E2 [Leptospirales bacterium]|nr:2-oxo acid dehydrogenase subunit E2 [Leptospirales bacterium]